MKTFHRICIKDFTLTDQDGQSASVRRGETYTTSEVRESKAFGVPIVVVFSRYWFPVPVSNFDSNPQPFTE